MNMGMSPLHANGKSKYYQRHAVDAREESVENEQQKILVIAYSDAVVHPGAVVIHLHDAASTDTGKSIESCPETIGRI